MMFTPAPYELLDFGNGRKLERFGTVVLDRPTPAAEGVAPGCAELWKTATARYHRADAQSGHWSPPTAAAEPWFLRHPTATLELRCTPSGAIGVFPEQAENWDWLAARTRAAARPPDVLNLFAYTGGSTLAAAAAGARVTHVDAARSVVQWARRNAEHSRLQHAPVRWIVEDAVRFARRERKRGHRYDGIILDPPSYGHGPHGEPWKIEQHLPPLLRTCRDLLSEQPLFLLLSCHAPQLGPAELEALLADCVFGHCRSGAQGTHLYLCTTDFRRLAAGQMARWVAPTRSSGPGQGA